MPSRGRSSFLILALAGAAFVALTLGRLPEPMAVHFGLRGDPDGWAGHGVYIVTIGIIGLVLPIGIVAMVSRLAATRPEALNVPGKDYWFQLARRAEGVRRVTEQMWWLGCLMLALAIALHALLLQANASVPPRLAASPFAGLLLGFLLGLALWMRGLNAAMRSPAS